MGQPDTLSSTVTEQEDLRFAKLISVVLHPFIVGPLAFLYFSITQTQSLWFGSGVWLITFVATDVVIGVYVSLMKHRGQTRSIDVPERIQRNKPFIIGVFGYVIATGILWLIGAPIVVVALMSIYAVNTAIATIINLRWKISIHGMSIGGSLVPFLFLFGGFWWLLVLCFPLMIYSRVKLRAHTLAQATAGIALAFVLTWIQLYLWL